MKFIRTTCCFMLTIILFSCGSSDNTEAPNSTPIDSTNASGTAPVEYNNPDNKDKEMLPEEANGDKVNTPGGDSIPSNTR